MKNKTTIFLSMVTFLIFVLQSCENRTKNTGEIKKNNRIQSGKKQADLKIIQDKETVLNDVFEFVEYDDDLDYTLLRAKKGAKLHDFVNDKNSDRSLLRGDICEIQWRKDTIYVAGEGETSFIGEFAISIEKIRDGKVSKLRKDYKTKFKYYWSKEENYSQSFLAKMYLLTEYYIANSKNKLFKHLLGNKEEIAFSIENRTRKNKDFTVMGIGYEFENRSNIFQWLYYDNENGKLYEYDLPNDELNEFK